MLFADQRDMTRITTFLIVGLAGCVVAPADGSVSKTSELRTCMSPADCADLPGDWTCDETQGFCQPQTPAPVGPLPEGWDEDLCDRSYYGTGDGCDCECGAPDPDCDGPSAEPPLLYGCLDEQVCRQGKCEHVTTCHEVWTGGIVDGQLAANRHKPDLVTRFREESGAWGVYTDDNPDPAEDPMWEAVPYNPNTVGGQCRRLEMPLPSGTQWFAFEDGCYDLTREVRAVEVNLKDNIHHCGACNKSCNGRCVNSQCLPMIIRRPPGQNGG